MTIDSTGRAHKPAGSPASTGGQFATQAAPAAAGTLTLERPAPSRSELSRDWSRAFPDAGGSRYIDRAGLLHYITAAAHDDPVLAEQVAANTPAQLAESPQVRELLRTMASEQAELTETERAEALEDRATRARLEEIAAAAIHDELTNHPDAADLSRDARRMAQALHTGAYQHNSLYFVQYDDELDGPQIDMLLAGDEEGLVDSTLEWSSESRSIAFGEITRELESKLQVELDWEERAEFEEYAIEHGLVDDNDYISELTERTRPQLMRVHAYGNGSSETMTGRASDLLDAGALTLDEYQQIGRNSDADYDVRTKVVESLLVEHLAQPRSEATAAAARDLVENGPGHWHEGVRLDLVWTGDVRDAALPGGEGATKTLRFEKPRIVLIDTLNGSFYDVDGSAPIEIELTAERHAVRDRADGRWGMDESAGLVGGAFSENAPTD